MRATWSLPALGAAACAGALILGAATSNAAYYRLEEVKPMWAKMDVDGDGYVNADELQAYDPRMLESFRVADFDRDGRLNLREFEVLLVDL